jgi:lysophospholipase L1-like esterase
MRRLVAGLALAAIAVAAALATAGAAPDRSGRDAKAFRGYVSCRAGGKHADAFCFVGDRPTAVLRAFGRSKVAYDVCFRKQGDRKHCRDRRTHGAGERSRTRFDIDGAGAYQVAFFSGGKVVARAKLVVRERAVFTVGDSLGEGTQPYLPGALPGWHVEQSVSTSRHVPEGVSILRSRGGLPAVIVFALGTNDDPRDVTGFANAIQALLEIAGKTRCVVVPNIVRPPVAGATYAGYNNVIAAAARHHDNFREADWAALVARNRGWLAGDGVHVTATGYMARARLIANQVERC